MGIVQIIKEEIESFLNEGISDILYHGTSVGALKNILKTNTINLTNAVGTPADIAKNKGNEYFFSTQRSKGKSGYIGKGGGSVILVLDGRKLAHKYKGFPIDYWNWSMDRKDWESDTDYWRALQSKELEDRIVSKNPTIDRANKYIEEIHIDKNWGLTKQDMVQIKTLARNRNIPVYLYDDKESFSLLNKEKSVKDFSSIEFKRDDEEVPEKIEREEEKRAIRLTKLMGILTYNDLSNYDELENILFTNLTSEEKEWLYNKIEEEHKKLNNLSGYYLDEYIRVLNADIHNNKSNPNKYIRQIFHMLVKDMRTYDVKTIKEYVERKISS